MSSSRSVAAAQRRRAGPSETQAPRGPNTSIQSSQAFSQQGQPMRPGTTGRLAGQHAALSQQQQMQQQQKQQQQNPVATSKMSIPQAITLITLRLGRLENQMQNLEGLTLNMDPSVLGTTPTQDDTIMNNILDRINALEQKSNENASLKQQVDLLKTAVIAAKNTSTINSKEIKDLKPLLEELQFEINGLKQQLELISQVDLEEDQGYLEEYQNVEELQVEEVVAQEIQEQLVEGEAQAEPETLDLKTMIEEEFNASIDC